MPEQIRFDKTFNVGHLIIFVSTVASFGSFYALTTYKLDTLAEIVGKLSDNHLATTVLSNRLDERLKSIENRLLRIEVIKGK